MVISPDEGGMKRCIRYSNMLGVDMGMFYKRRDYSVIVEGRNPIIAHEFLGANVQGKDVLVVDDMISSGDSIIDVCTKLKDLGAERVFACAAFGLFSAGLERIDAAHKKGLFDKIFTCDMVYQPPELLAREWYVSVRMSKYISYLIDTLNHDMSISRLLSPTDRIQRLLIERGFRLG
jgi:ribose-phosphate pyrophosphokinase